MSRILYFLEEGIKTCNVFRSPVNLRYKLDPDYKTFAGGFVSIILITLLMSVFFNSWVDLLNKDDISSVPQVIRQINPSLMNVSSDDFMFTVGVKGMNLTDQTQKKYFYIKMAKYDITNNVDGTWKRNVTSFYLEPCTIDNWVQLGNQFTDTFNRQGISGFLCVPRNTSIDLAGKYSSQKFIYYKLTVEKCFGKPDCRTQSEVDDWIAANTSFNFNFYYSNNLLNPDQKEPISKIFQDKDYMMFSPTMASSTNLYLGEYEMNTDESLFPWKDAKVQKGFFINRAQKQQWDYVPTSFEPYCKLFLRKSNLKLQIQRKFRKLDDMLSYIGGLFGIIAMAVGVVMNYYSQCSFQLQMCQNIFDYHNRKSNKTSIQENLENLQNQSQYDPTNRINFSGNPQTTTQILQQPQEEVIQPKNFGFFDFFIHILIYLPLRKICNLKWRRMQIYQESLQEMRHKLDISQLLEKLAFYDRSLNTLFDESQLKLLYLQEKFNFQEVREERGMLSMRNDIVANLFGMITDLIKDPSDDPEGRKKSLKEIAMRKSRTKIKTFVGVQAITVHDLLGNSGFKKHSTSQNEDDMNLPADIKNALKKLDQKIEKGDTVSIRIYNGLQYELLAAFERSKLNRNNYSVVGSGKIKKVKDKSRNELRLLPRQDRRYEINFADVNGSPSLVSINRIASIQGYEDQ